MSTQTKVKCDRCGHEYIVGDKEKARTMYAVVVTYHELSDQGVNYGTYRADAGKADWCEPCCEEFGIWRARTKPDEPKPEYPTLEDLIREIAREEAEDVATG